MSWHPRLTVILVARDEASYLYRTLRSLMAAKNCAEEVARVSVALVLSRADRATREVAQSFPGDLEIHDSNEFLLERALNLGVARSEDDFVAYVRAKDLVCGTWLKDACTLAASQRDTLSVYHPRFSVGFGGGSCRVTEHLSSIDRGFDPLAFIQKDCWTPTFLAPRAVLEKVPLPELTQDGFGHPFRLWYSQVLAAGVPVRTVNETCVFERCPPTVCPLPAPSEPLLMPRSELLELNGDASKSSVSFSRRTFPPAVRFRPVLAAAETVFKKFNGLASRNRRVCDAMIVMQRLGEWAYNAIPKPKPKASMLEPWLVDQWKAIHRLEPELFPRVWPRPAAPIQRSLQSEMADAYADLCRRFGTKATHVLLVPWLIPAGADREVLNYVHALAEKGFAESTVVIADQNVESPWSGRLPAGVRFIEFGRLYHRLWRESQVELLSRLLIQKSPPVIHNINSPIAYQAFLRYGRALRAASRLYCLVFCDNVTRFGRTVGYVHEYLPRCLDHLTAVFCDNRAFVRHLGEVFGLSPAKFHVHYQPILSSAMERPPAANATEPKTLNVLWAGRFDRQKRPDLLVAVAQRCLGRPVRFHAYGYAHLDPMWSAVRRTPNIKYHGPYNGFDSLPIHEFDAYLYTSQWDGLPNVLLEVMAAGLPVIASNAGGVGELVIHGKTGFLVDPFDNVDQFVAALEGLTQRRTDVARMVKAGRELLANQHSWESFVRQLESVPGYLNPRSETSLPAP